MAKIDVRFIDGGREAEEKADPRHPNGVTVSLAEHVLQKTCTVNLPYPAPRCGVYEVACLDCQFVGVVTVAGRADDPRIITIPCKAKGMN